MRMFGAPVSRYVLFRMIPWIGVVLFGATSIFLTTQLLRTAPVFIGAGLLPGVKAILLLIVPLIAFSMGPAFLIALFAVASKMSETNELSAIDALGISRVRIQAHLILFLSVSTLVNAGLWIFIAPSAVRQTREIAVSLLRSAAVDRLKIGQFNQPSPGLVFFADQKKGDDTFLQVLVEQQESSRRFEVVAKKASLRVTETFDIILHFTDGHAFITSLPPAVPRSADAESSRASVAFRDFELTVPLGDVLKQKLDFLPEVLCVSTMRLLKPPPSGISAVEWDFAFWRRIAGPVGFFFLVLFGILVAFGVPWTHRAQAVLWAVAVFLFFHLSGRTAESSAIQGRMSPALAAFFPAIVSAVSCAPVVAVRSLRRLWTKRRRIRMTNPDDCSKSPNGIKFL